MAPLTQLPQMRPALTSCRKTEASQSKVTILILILIFSLFHSHAMIYEDSLTLPTPDLTEVKELTELTVFDHIRRKSKDLPALATSKAIAFSSLEPLVHKRPRTQRDEISPNGADITGPDYATGWAGAYEPCEPGPGKGESPHDFLRPPLAVGKAPPFKSIFSFL